MKINRVFLIVLDSVGIGGAADAKDFGDDNPDTLKSIAASKNFDTPNLARLGLFNIDGINFYRREENPRGSFARVCEADWALGDCGDNFRTTVADLSRRFSARSYR